MGRCRQRSAAVSRVDWLRVLRLAGRSGPETLDAFELACLLHRGRQGAMGNSRTLLTARHANGWDTHVAQTDNGKYAAWAAPRGIRGMSEFVDLDETTAKAAALRSLERRTGHARCTSECTAWEPAESRATVGSR
jgi:hypothetical protein